jgi:hypothetical protein
MTEPTPACAQFPSLGAPPCGSPAPMVFVSMCVHEHLTPLPWCFACCDTAAPVYCPPCRDAGHLCEVQVLEVGQVGDLDSEGGFVWFPALPAVSGCPVVEDVAS